VNRATGVIIKSLGNPEADLPQNRWNDGKCDPLGRLFVGSMLTTGDDPPGQGALWCLDTDGTWSKKIESTSISNGLVWSSDGKKFWWIDSPTGNVYAYDYDLETGSISNRQIAIRHFNQEGKPDKGYPDGCCIDAEDKIWIAAWEGGAVFRYDPSNGELLSRHEVPGASLVTSCSFGGANLDTLFVTTASCGLSDAQLEAQPNAGALFALDLSGTGIKGAPPPPYKGAAAPKH